MKAKEVLEKNRVIAEFMSGFPKVGNKYGFTKYPNQYEETISDRYRDVTWIKEYNLCYHYSWDWLKPCIDKCWKEQGRFGEGLGFFQNVTIFKPIEEAYDAVILFINYYNQRNKETK